MLVGCSSGSSETSSGGGNSEITLGASLGVLSIYLTDALTGEVSSVNVYITGLTLKGSAATVERFSDGAGLIDLVTLCNSTRLMAEAYVPAGDYEFTRGELDQSRRNVIVKSTMETLPQKYPAKN